jgi:hypothetical protein
MSTEYYTDTPTQQKERLMKIKSRKVRKAITLPDPRPEPQEQERKVYDTVFICYDNTPIIFGKLKEKHHSILKQPEWANYCEWIIKQGAEFKYQGTRTYIIDNVDLN